MKVTKFLMAIMSFISISLFVNTAHATLQTPTLTVSTSGTSVSLEWSLVSGATGYTIYYAPYPFQKPIRNIDVGNQNNFFVNLWGGAAFYVAVQAYNSNDESRISNIEYFIIENVFGSSGYWDVYIAEIDTHKIDALYLKENNGNLEGVNILNEPVSGTISGANVNLSYHGGMFSGILIGESITGNINIDGTIYNMTLEDSNFHFTNFYPGQYLTAPNTQFAWTEDSNADKYFIRVMRDNQSGNCGEDSSCISIWEMDNINDTDITFNEDGTASEELTSGNLYRVRVFSLNNNQSNPTMSDWNSFLDTTMDVIFKVQ